MEMLTCTIHL